MSYEPMKEYVALLLNDWTLALQAYRSSPDWNGSYQNFAKFVGGTLYLGPVSELDDSGNPTYYAVVELNDAIELCLRYGAPRKRDYDQMLDIVQGSESVGIRAKHYE